MNDDIKAPKNTKIFICLIETLNAIKILICYSYIDTQRQKWWQNDYKKAPISPDDKNSYIQLGNSVNLHNAYSN